MLGFLLCVAEELLQQWADDKLKFDDDGTIESSVDLDLSENRHSKSAAEVKREWDELAEMYEDNDDFLGISIAKKERKKKIEKGL